ncbi:MAG: hypothetical protein H6626_00860 [Pseudobdellovibrionaceae bacterium]|nr:hypothetical protein [Bdellovibrionales bacterium]USN47674.1 MAG: hypothetical protein H6626_00860 [Pseudobdellovibrionaceae bacterium]
MIYQAAAAKFTDSISSAHGLTSAFMSVIQSPKAWENTMNAPENSSLRCSSAESGNSGKIVLYDASNRLYFDPVSSESNGVTYSHVPCVSFDGTAGSGSNECPFRMELTWDTVCPECSPPMIKVHGELKYNPNAKSVVINPGHMDFSIFKSATGGIDGTVKDIAQGREHACALLGSGQVLCWGDNSKGQLGDGTTTDRADPAVVPGMESGVDSVFAVHHQTCALKVDGTLWCWGDNERGNLGSETIPGVKYEVSPKQITGLGGTPISIAMAYRTTCVLLDTTGVECMGYNGDGQFGANIDLTDYPSPTPAVEDTNVKAIDEGPFHGCAVDVDGKVMCFGANEDGQLGNNGSIDSKIPVDVFGLSTGYSMVVSTGQAGEFFSCALSEAGNVKCWGDNNSGQLGNGNNVSSNIPVDVSGIGDALSITAGMRHVCAITTAGGLKCWGNNNHGQLGNGTTTNSNIPVDVIGLSSGVKKVVINGDGTCALMEDNHVKCWGDNDNGQVGDGTTIERHEPVNAIIFDICE